MYILKIISFEIIIKCLIIFSFVSTSLFSQNTSIQKYQYISPVPGSSMNRPETNIIIREGNLIDSLTLSFNKIRITGSKSGDHQFRIKLVDDGKTVIIYPEKKFRCGETVYFNFNGGIYMSNGDKLPDFSFQFKISESDPSLNKSINISERLGIEDIEKQHRSVKGSNIIINGKPNEYPPDFPITTIVTSNNPSPGYYFLAPFYYPSQNIGYLLILDNTGIPVFYKRTHGVKADWKIQPNGLLTYYDLETSKFYAMDSSYSIVDTFYTGNGYETDIHELRLLPNGHALLQAYDNQRVRMDTIVNGGNPNALVTGLIVQEIDSGKNVIFQWRSWDHFKITDATEDINLTASYIDYVHGNAIEVDADSNLLISCRHMDEITKIDRQTGDIIWRWGGAKSKNNQFTFINDPITFSHQHHIRLLVNGNYSLFDNGNLHIPSVSRGLEYRLDQIDTTAELIWDYQHDPGTFSFAMGNVQELSNDSKIIGWGWSFTDPRAITEINGDGTVELELSLQDSALSYRAFKFPWKTNLFVTNPDSLFFDSVYVGDTLSSIIEIINNSSDSLNITGFYNTDSVFSVTLDSLPFIIPPLGSTPISVNFIPDKYGEFKDVLHIRSDTDTSRIAQVMALKGKADTIKNINDINEFNKKLSYKLRQNYPNPFNPVTTIEFEIPEREFVSLKVYDVRGSEVANLVDGEKSAGSYKVRFNAYKLSTGIYFYRLQAGSYVDVKKLLLLR